MRGIVCPKCSGETSVSETRHIDGAIRRRRVCDVVTCGGKTTTLEIIAPSYVSGSKLPLALVPERELRRLHDVIGSMLKQSDEIKEP